MRGPLNIQKSLQGAGIRILTPTVSSPTLADQLQSFLKVYPQAKWHAYEPVNRDNVLEGAKLAFGQPVETQYKLENADVILSLDADFLYAGFPGFTRYARDFAKRRNPDAGEMSRLYVAESTPSSTGARADHRLPLRAMEVESFVRALDMMLGDDTDKSMVREGQQKFLEAVVKDLKARRGSSVVLAGDHQPAVVHAFVHRINQTLGNIGKTVFYTDPVDANPVNQTESLKDLVADMRGGKVDMLIIMGGNPAYDAPADLGFADALKSTNIPLRVHLGLYQNETAELCQWHVNEAHYLEAWGDARAYDGTVSIVQPLIAPLYNGKSAYELATMLSGQADTGGHEIVQAYWKKQHSGADFDTFWRKSLHDGWVEGTTFAPKPVANKTAGFPSTPGADEKAIEINFRRDPSIYDGQFSNNGWLQELPKPMNKLTWDNPVLMGPAMAERMGIKTEDLVELELNGKKVTAPVWIQVGHPDNSVTVFLGYGRRRAGRVGTGAGFDMYQLRTSATPWIASGVAIRKAGGTYKLASTQGYQTMDTAHRHEAAGAYCEHRRLPQGARLRARRRAAQGVDLVQALSVCGRALRLGHDGRHECLRGLQQLHRRLPVGEQYSRRGQGADCARPAHALAARGFLLPGRSRQSQSLLPAGTMPAVRERALRSRLSGRRDRSQQRRIE